MERMELWTQRGKERVGQIEKVALKYIYIYITMCKIGFRGGSGGKKIHLQGRRSGFDEIWHGNPLQYSCLENPHE